MSSFTAELMSPLDADDWGFIVLPQKISADLPRRGRVTVQGKLDGHAFTAQLEPDGQRSHWLKVEGALFKSVGARLGKKIKVTLNALEDEPAPDLPADLKKALKNSAEATATWNEATPVAQVDWIHWIESAKQQKTRDKRVAEAINKLQGGQKRVCCFDPSGFYSKAFSAPQSAK